MAEMANLKLISYAIVALEQKGRDAHLLRACCNPEQLSFGSLAWLLTFEEWHVTVSSSFSYIQRLHNMQGAYVIVRYIYIYT